MYVSHSFRFVKFYACQVGTNVIHTLFNFLDNLDKCVKCNRQTKEDFRLVNVYKTVYIEILEKEEQRDNT